MITPAYGLTASERVLPSFALDWTTGFAQDAVGVARTGVATFVGSNGFIQSADENTQRVDYSTGISGILIEESRTNLAKYSEDFSNAIWVKTGASIISDAVLAPNGAVASDKLQEDTGTSGHSLGSEAFTWLGNTAYTYSFYAQEEGRPRFDILFGTAGNWVGGRRVVFDLSAGVVVSTDGAVGRIVDVGNGIYRCSASAVTSDTPTPSGVFARLISSGTTTSYAGDGVSGIGIWGAQLEAGAFPTSYIPTTSSAVTRNADVATVTGANFSDFFNATEGTFAATTNTFNTLSTTTPYVLVALGNIQNRISMQYQTSQRFLSWIRLAGVASTMTWSSVNRGELHRATLAYKTDDSAAAFDGDSVLAPATQPAGIPACTELTLGRYGNGGFLNGRIQKIQYWPYRLTNAELLAFSKKES